MHPSSRDSFRFYRSQHKTKRSSSRHLRMRCFRAQRAPRIRPALTNGCLLSPLLVQNCHRVLVVAWFVRGGLEVSGTPRKPELSEAFRAAVDGNALILSKVYRRGAKKE